MAKSIAEDIRDLMNKMEAAAGPRAYDLELEVENWDFPENPNDESWPSTVVLGINYTVAGKHRPATWGYHGGTPEEFPEIDTLEVFNTETGQQFADLPPEVDEQIEQAIWNDVESKKYDADDYDRYD